MDHRKTIIDTNDAEIRRLEAIADWLDSKFVIPGTKLRFGLDFVLGILPGVGDGVAAVPAAYLILEAQRLGAPPALLMRMGFNVLLDLAIGAIPLVGDLFDFGFKANRRNIALLKQYLGIDEIPRSRD
ncbi:MAG: DUF4112 domain-containing protein [Rhodospirillaceae bacterium]|nr:DUF4112 domain-containing protein [Rhodospirillaceae bacterium]MDD9924758.1 DUF4112 domain-containing protein [Rhodospirillaceae bacterium]